MKAFFIKFFILCKRQLKNPFFIFLLLGFPFLGFGIHTLEQKSTSANSDTVSLSIAIYCENPDTFTENFFEDILESSSFHFYRANSLSSLKTEVASGYAECGYLFPDNFHSLLLNEDYKRKIVLYTSPSSLFASLSKEVVFASLFRLFAEDMAVSYIKSSSIFASIREDAISLFSPQYQSYIKDTAHTSLFHLLYETVQTDGKITANAIAPSFVPMPVRGLFAVLLFLNALTSSAQALEDKNKKISIPFFLSIGIPFLFFTLSGWITLWLTQNFTSFFYELFAASFYFFILYIFCRFFSYLCKKPFFIIASIPFFTLGSIIFCPIFINISSVIPIFSLLEKFFLPYYYLSLF